MRRTPVAPGRAGVCITLLQSLHPVVSTAECCSVFVWQQGGGTSMLTAPLKEHTVIPDVFWAKPVPHVDSERTKVPHFEALIHTPLIWISCFAAHGAHEQ